MDALSAKKAQLLSPEYPWNNTKIEDIGPCVMKFLEDHEPFYRRWAETFFNNFSFVYGNQSIRWSKRYGYAVDTDFLQRLPSQTMRAQTNIARTLAEALASMIYSGLPEWDADTAEQSAIRGKRFKRIAQKILDAYMERLCMHLDFSTAAMIFAVYGMVGAWIDWDMTAGKLLEIPRFKKIKAPVFTDYMAANPFTQGLLEVPTPATDSYGEPAFEERWEPVLDEMARQIVDRISVGDVKIDILTPFEFRREIGSQGMHKTKYVERIRLIDYDQFLDEYGKVEGKTKYFNNIRPVYSNPAVYKIAVRHFMRMQFTTPPGLSDLSQRPENVYRNSLFKNKVLVIEHYDRPHPLKWKVGRRLVIVNGECTHVTVPTYNTNKMDGWHPCVEAQWLNVAPSNMASGPLNDAIQKNRELNIADSLIATALRRNMGSHLLIKSGMGIDPQRFSGEPGLSHEVPDPFALRYLHDDMPISPAVPQLRESIKDDIYETSGAMDSLRGDRSKGVSAGYALRQLQEREEKRLTPAKRRFEMFVSGMGEKVLICLKTNVVRLDDNVMGFLLRAGAGEFQPQDVIAFLKNPMDYGIDVNVKENSMAMRSKATQQATIQELGQTAAVSDRLKSSAKVLDEYLKYFDAQTLRDPSSEQRDRAGRENEVFTDMLRLGADTEGIPRPIVIFEDDDDIHIEEHTLFMLQNSDEILKNEVFLQQLLVHMEQHRIQKEEKAAKLMPGTMLQVPNMASAVRKITPPTVQTIFQKSIIDQQAKMAEAAQPGQPGPPTAPNSPAPAGAKGPGEIPTGTPAAQTPTGAKTEGKI